MESIWKEYHFCERGTFTTVLTSPNKDETAVHGCNPTLSVLVTLVSGKFNFLRNISTLLLCLYVS